MKASKTEELSKSQILALWLIAIGLTRRSIVLLFLFLLIFVAGSLCFLVVQSSSDSLTWLLLTSPLIVLDIFFAYILFNPNMKKTMKIIEKEGKVISFSGVLSIKEVVGTKVKIIMACWGTFIAIGIILVTFLIMLGIEDKIEIFLYLYNTIGLITIFLLFWPFYSKRLK